MLEIDGLKEGVDYNVVDHTADFSLEVIAPSVECLFEKCALVLTRHVFDFSFYTPKKLSRMEFVFGKEDLEGFLVEFLNELLYRLYEERFVALAAHIEILDSRVHASLYGERLKKKDFKVEQEIKSATYHGLKIKDKSGNKAVRIVFDV